MNPTDVVDLTMNILTIIAILGGITIGSKKWIKKWIREVSTQLDTGNGHTIGQYTEKTSSDLSKIREEVQEFRSEMSSDMSNDLIEYRFKKLEDRFDQHIQACKNKAA